MCRIFGFRSVIQSQVHRSLVSADNALMRQSGRHPDGWGVAYFNAGSPHVVKSVSSAEVDVLFRRVCGVVASQTVLAHLRKATHGARTILNTHPFQFGPWVFVHNGNVSGFERCRDGLLARISPGLRRYILGDTDSELLFHLLLEHMAKRCDLTQPRYALSDLIAAVRAMVKDIVAVAGKLCLDDRGPATETFATFAITNGTTMLAHQGGKSLFFSTYKRRCPDRGECPSYGNACEAEAPAGGFIKHLLISSEPLHGDNVWTPMRPFEMVGVDWRMQLRRIAAP